MKKECINSLKFQFPSYSVNESAARTVTASFCALLNPTVEELSDIRCAVSEAVTNCTVHAYKNMVGMITIDIKLYSDRSIKIDVRDRGCGIEDVSAATAPLYTTDPEGERSGMGFTVMESFMDSMSVHSTVGKGTRVSLKKRLSILPVKK